MTDKQSHFLVGLVIAFLVSFYSPLAAYWVVVIVAAGKELVWDWAMDNGTPEINDFIATIVGGAAGIGAHAFL